MPSLALSGDLPHRSSQGCGGIEMRIFSQIALTFECANPHLVVHLNLPSGLLDNFPSSPFNRDVICQFRLTCPWTITFSSPPRTITFPPKDFQRSICLVKFIFNTFQVPVVQMNVWIDQLHIIVSMLFILSSKHSHPGIYMYVYLNDYQFANTDCVTSYIMSLTPSVQTYIDLIFIYI